MLKSLRKRIIQRLWEHYRDSTPQMQLIEKALKKKGITHLILDHFAMIDLPGPNTGIPYLKKLFCALGYTERGKDYLAAKQNDFLWMAEADCDDSLAKETLPQVVVADFRLDEMPNEIKKIIEKYSQQTKPTPLNDLEKTLQSSHWQNPQTLEQITQILLAYFSNREWPLPTKQEFQTVQEFNELLAWVLIFGRRPNHFTLSIHLLDYFPNLEGFHAFVEKETQLTLNSDGGVIKGGMNKGIAQGSTVGVTETLALQDGDIKIPTGFVEFVWRYPREPNNKTPELWKDYFTGFIAQHADHVIESLYTNDCLVTLY